MTNQNLTAWLEGISGDYRGMRIPLPQADTLLGRSQVCDVRISKENVSRQHAKIRFAEGRYYLQDQGSALGTRLNGQSVQASVINDGDQISIGDTIFRFHLQKSIQPARHIVAQAPDQIIQPDRDAAYPVEQGRSAYQQEDAIAYGAAKAIAMNKSFVGKAWLTWALYYFGVGVVGLIFNIVYLREANKVQDITGQSPPGKGCLVSLLVLQGIGFVILILVLIATEGALLDSF